MSSPARKQAASTEPKSPTSTGNDVLYDLALKRYDFITKAFDTSNSRASAIFAFSSLLVTGSVAALQKMVTENFHEEIVQWCVTIDLSIFLILAICCLFAYGITQIWTLPDALKLHPELARLSTERAKEQILQLVERDINREYEDKVKCKNRFLRCAIYALVAEVVVVFVMSCLPFLPHRKWNMSHDGNKKNTESKPQNTAPANASPPDGGSADMAARAKIPDLLGPIANYSARVGMGRDMRNVHTLEKPTTGARTLERSPRKS